MLYVGRKRWTDDEKNLYWSKSQTLRLRDSQGTATNIFSYGARTAHKFLSSGLVPINSRCVDAANPSSRDHSKNLSHAKRQRYDIMAGEYDGQADFVYNRVSPLSKKIESMAA